MAKGIDAHFNVKVAPGSELHHAQIVGVATTS